MARRIELLSPARDVTIAREAILHGADAVYIGAPKFSARVAAGNSIEECKKDIELSIAQIKEKLPMERWPEEIKGEYELEYIIKQ